MSIVSGYKKFKKYILTSSGFQLVSHWTNANTLQFDDGKTAQAKLGAIDGISSSKDSSSEKIAASTKLVSELNSNLGGYQFRVNNGIAEYKAGAGSDWVRFKKAGFEIPSLYAYVGGSNRMCKLETTLNVTDINTLYIGSVSKYNNGAWRICTVQGIKADNTKVNIGLKTGVEINVTEYSSVYIQLIPDWDTNQESFVQLKDIRAY